MASSFSEFTQLVCSLREDDIADQLVRSQSDVDGPVPIEFTFYHPNHYIPPDEQQDIEVDIDDDDDDDNTKVGEQRIYDSSTRWPLDPEDILIPQWQLRKEILQFARKAAPRNPLFEPPPPPILSTEDNAKAYEKIKEEIENEALLPLPEMITKLLSYIVDIVAGHLHPEVGGALNRSRIIDWQDVLDVLSGSLHGKNKGPLTFEILECARDRLEDLYGAPDLELRYMDLPIDPCSPQHAHNLAFPAESTFNSSPDTETDNDPLAVPPPLPDLRTKRAALKQAFAEIQDELGETLDDIYDDYERSTRYSGSDSSDPESDS